MTGDGSINLREPPLGAGSSGMGPGLGGMLSLCLRFKSFGANDFKGHLSIA